MKGGLLAILGGKPPKGGEDDEEEGEESPESSEGGGGHKELLGDAFDALKDGDRKGFIRSMKAAIDACKE